MHPTVCVIIAAYNASATIARAVASALAEPEVTEVVVVDDASSDETVAVAKSFDDGSGRLKILVQERNNGPASARNRAIDESTAPWIAVLDADDYFLPGRIKKLLAFSEGHDLVADDLWQVPENNINGPRKNVLGITTPRIIGFEEFVLSNVTRSGKNRQEMGFIQPLMRRHFLEQHHLRYREHLRLGEDYEFYARALGLNARLLLVPPQGYMCVVRADSLSSHHSEQDLLTLRECDNALLAELSLNKPEQKALRRHYLSIDCRLQWRLLILSVKKRDGRAAINTFLRPYPVPLYLVKQLLKQAWLRSLKRLNALRHGEHNPQ